MGSDGDLGLDRLAFQIGNRRGALVALLAGAAGAQSARASDSSKRKRRRQRSKINNRNNNRNHNKSTVKDGGEKDDELGDGTAASIVVIESTISLPETPGVVTATTEACPEGYFAVAGGFQLAGAEASGLIGEGPRNSDSGWMWEVQLNITTVGTNASITVIGICLEARVILES